MSALVALILGLVQALAPLAAKLVTGQMSAADAKAAADKAVADYLKDSANLKIAEEQDDAAAEAEAEKLP